MADNDIAAYLEALDRDDCYRVERVLKQTPSETTELVFFQGANDSRMGPFVRKRIKHAAETGHVYRVIWENQKAGKRFLFLPTLYDYYDRDDESVIVMEYVEGKTIQDVVYERDPSVALAREVFPLICDAVIELHERFSPPIIHRDLKPGNIILSDQGLTIIDFGIARLYNEQASVDTTTFGTRAYAPPEQFGYGQTDVRSDVYALGMVLYYLLREQVPEPGLAGGPFAFDDIPVSLRPLLARATAFDPADRFQSVRELKQAFVSQVDAAPNTAVSSLSLSEALGIAWDIMLAIGWIFMLVICSIAVVSPTESVAMYPSWLVFMMFFGCVMTGVTGTVYLIADKRLLGRRLAFFAPPNRKRNLVIAIGLLVVSFLFLMISGAIIGYQYPST